MGHIRSLMSRWQGYFIHHDNNWKYKYDWERWMDFTDLVSNDKSSLEFLFPFLCLILQAKKIKSGALVEKIGQLLILLEENPTLPETEFLIHQLNEKPQSVEVTREDILKSDSCSMLIMTMMEKRALDPQEREKEVLEIVQVKEILENIKIIEADMKRYLDKTDICNMRDDVTRYLDAQLSREVVRNLLQITDELKDGLTVFFELAAETQALIEDLRFLITFFNDCANKSPHCIPTLLSKISICRLEIICYEFRDDNTDILSERLFGRENLPLESIVKSTFDGETGIRQVILRALTQVSDIKKLVMEIKDQTPGKKGIFSGLFLGRLREGYQFKRFVKKIRMRNSQWDEFTSSFNIWDIIPNEMDIVVGIESTLIITARLIQSSPHGLEILTIVGMAGIGKSILATEVFINPVVSSNFDCRALVEICADYEMKNLFYRLLSCVSLPSYAINERSTTDIGKHLRSCLKGRRYLIVIDGIASVETWDAVRQFFPDDRNKSRIILTTQSMQLATSANPNNTHYRMNLLDEYESWEFLKKKLFGRKSCPPKLLETGKQIAKKCLGLPSAIAYVANLLSENWRHNWWMLIENSLNSLECRNPEEYQKILSLDVDQLLNTWRRFELLEDASRN